MQGFISYCHDDHRMFCEFRTHMMSLERAYGIDLWADSRVVPGYDWTASIEEAIGAADVFFLLTSADFIASDYIYKEEIPAIKSRRRNSGALVVPVILKRCAWQIIADVLQAVPTESGDVKPIADWRRHSDGFDHARIQIAAAIEGHFGRSARPVRWNAP
jgi:hypothetical protein